MYSLQWGVHIIVVSFFSHCGQYQIHTIPNLSLPHQYDIRVRLTQDLILGERPISSLLLRAFLSLPFFTFQSPTNSATRFDVQIIQSNHGAQKGPTSYLQPHRRCVRSHCHHFSCFTLQTDSQLDPIHRLFDPTVVSNLGPTTSSSTTMRPHKDPKHPSCCRRAYDPQ